MISSDDNSFLKNRSGLPDLFLWQALVPAFVFGILSIKWMLPSFVAFAVYLFLYMAIRPQKGVLVLFFILYGIGNWYGNYSLPPEPASMPGWMAEREKVHLHGEIHSIKGIPGKKLRILLKNVVCNSTDESTALNGYLNWTWEKPDVMPEVGQAVTMFVRVKPVHGFRNNGLWDYDFYCRTKDIGYRTYSSGPIKNGGLKTYEPDGLQKLRASLRSHIMDNAPPTQGGAFFPALLTGDRFLLSQDTVELVRRAGVSHVLALSGLHVGFIVAIGFGLAWIAGWISTRIYLLIPRMRLGVLFSAPLVLAYLWLGQFTPSLARAVCMFAFWGILMFMNRGRVLLDGLFLAVVLILVLSPLSVFDLGFQLSVLAVSGIALLYPRFEILMPSGHNLFGRAVRFVLAIMYVSVCANIALLPVLIWNFGVLTPNFMFNLLFVPVTGLFIMPFCGAGGLFASYFSPVLSQKLFAVGAGCFEWMLELIRRADQVGLLPEHASYRPHWEGVLIYYLLLGMALFLLSGRKRYAKAFLVSVIVLLSVRIYGELGHGHVRMDILDTGQSQCVVITGPQGSRTVVDGGGGFGRSFDMGRSIVGPWLTYGHLPQVDNIFMTHGDRDHAGGLAFLLEKFSVGKFYSNGDMPVGSVGERFEKAFAEKGLKPRVLNKGDVIELEPGLQMEVLHPSESFEGRTNDRSLYLRLVLNGNPLLGISGDLDKKGIRTLLESGQDMTSGVLVLPHHGSAGSFSSVMYDKVSPRLALAACGFLNRYKFVSKKVRAELKKREIPLFATALEGQITVEWNSEGVIVASPLN